MDIKEINIKLADVYGKPVDVGLPKYRVVLAGTQTEKRYGKWTIVDEETGRFLREEEGVDEVPKYDHNIKDFYVLEVLESTVGNPYLEMVCKFSYEPMWTFGVGGSSPIVEWWAVELLIKTKLEARDKAPVTAKDHARHLEAHDKKESDKIREVLKDDAPNLPYMLKHGMAVVVPGKLSGTENTVAVESKKVDNAESI